MSRKKKLGLFGGTFNPVHHGHLIVAEWLMYSLEIEKVFFIPSNVHPFKEDENVISADHRKKMLQLALQDYPEFEISEFELVKNSVSYSIETIEFFKSKYADYELYFFIGEDNVKDFFKWKEPLKILDLAYLTIYRRGESSSIELYKHHKVLLIDSPLIDISSTHIRNRIKKQISFKSLVPSSVHKYIIENKLYI